jgi:hypothetical protein
MALVMAFVVLFSTMSFTIHKHYCGETLMDTAIFKQLKKCEMEQSVSNVPLGCSVTKKDCCTDKQQTISGQNELQLTFDKVSLDQHIFVAVFLHTYRTLLEVSEEATPSLRIYPPPLIVKQLYKLDETYLI